MDGVTENREIRSSVFADLFGDDEIVGKRNFLNLYNALHGTALEYGKTDIERRTVPQSAYRSLRNDISMLVGGRLIVFVEHQSTLNENMPLRFLEYFVHILHGIVPRRARYRKGLYKIPTPEFYVFYNGSSPAPGRTQLRLSDAFLEPQGEPACELKVEFLNLGSEGTLPIRRNCATLGEYCQFMDLVLRKRHVASGTGSGCYEAAIREAVSRGILADYLPRKSTEVMNMFLDEYDYETDIAVQREEAFEDGMERGVLQGAEQKALEAARNLLRLNVGTAEQIAQATGLSAEEVQELAQDMRR